MKLKIAQTAAKVSTYSYLIFSNEEKARIGTENAVGGKNSILKVF